MELNAPVCLTCGAQFPAGDPPADCLICKDSRQYVHWDGQQWTSLLSLQQEHGNCWSELEPSLHSIHTRPSFAIGQRAFLLQTREGNLLWDCVALLDDETLQRVRELGGLKAIAISHPHYYTAMVEWSHAFGRIPIYLHQRDRKWVMRPDPAIRFWRGDRLPLFSGLQLVLTGGHFDGYQVLLWPDGAERRGVLLAGDQPQVAMDRDWVAFQYSYPNYIPLGPKAVRRIAATLKELPFDRLYGAFPGKRIMKDARRAIARSAARHIRIVTRG